MRMVGEVVGQGVWGRTRNLDYGLDPTLGLWAWGLGPDPNTYSVMDPGPGAGPESQINQSMSLIFKLL